MSHSNFLYLKDNCSARLNNLTTGGPYRRRIIVAMDVLAGNLNLQMNISTRVITNNIATFQCINYTSSSGLQNAKHKIKDKKLQFYRIT